MSPAHARAVVDAFAHSDPHPPCDAAVADDLSILGLEWTFPDGRMLVIDIHEDGSVQAFWKDNK